LFSHLSLLLVLRSLDSLVNGKDHAGKFIGSLEIILLNQKRLPDEVLISVLDEIDIIEDVDSPGLAISLLGMDSS
jgi:hypothetical protein